MPMNHLPDQESNSSPCKSGDRLLYLHADLFANQESEFFLICRESNRYIQSDRTMVWNLLFYEKIFPTAFISLKTAKFWSMNDERPISANR